MKGMIFAAGLGTRLHPFTLTKPKALVEVGGVPMLGRVISKVEDSGVKELVVNVHHFSKQVIDYISRLPINGVKISISDESDLLLDTGGGLKRASGLLAGDEPVLVHNADILTDFSLPEMMAAHEKSGADVTLLVSSRKTSRHLLFNEDGRMVGWNNTLTGQYKPEYLKEDCERLVELAFGGVHILSPAALEMLCAYDAGCDAFSIIPFYIDSCQKLDIRAYVPSRPYHWFDVGKPETLQAAREASLRGEI